MTAGQGRNDSELTEVYRVSLNNSDGENVVKIAKQKPPQATLHSFLTLCCYLKVDVFPPDIECSSHSLFIFSERRLRSSQTDRKQRTHSTCQADGSSATPEFSVLPVQS